MGVNDKAKELAAAVAGTREFSELKQTRSNIERNRELKSKMDDLKKREEIIYSGRLSASEAQQKSEELKKIFESLSRIPEIDKFLKAQKNFNTMMQNVYKIINDTLEATIKL